VDQEDNSYLDELGHEFPVISREFLRRGVF